MEHTTGGPRRPRRPLPGGEGGWTGTAPLAPGPTRSRARPGAAASPGSPRGRPGAAWLPTVTVAPGDGSASTVSRLLAAQGQGMLM